LIVGGINVISTYTSILIVSAITLTLVFLNAKHTKKQLKKDNQSYSIFSKKLTMPIIRALTYSLFMPVFFHNSCLSFYNNSIGYYNPTLGFVVNTQLSRYFQLPKACPVGPPCHLYATVPEDTASSVFINIHTHKSIFENVAIYYDTE